MSRWLEFRANSNRTIGVWNRKTNEFLGLIHYHRGWRRHVFMTENHSLNFSDDCLRSIAYKLKNMKKRRRRSRNWTW
jgi:hypothetical protein